MLTRESRKGVVGRGWEASLLFVTIARSRIEEMHPMFDCSFNGGVIASIEVEFFNTLVCCVELVLSSSLEIASRVSLVGVVLRAVPMYGSPSGRAVPLAEHQFPLPTSPDGHKTGHR